MAKVDQVFLPIKNCGECPKMEAKRYYTADSWEHVMDWSCIATNPQKHIAYVENKSDEPKSPPKWCPLRK